jgi:hypothetical protein
MLSKTIPYFGKLQVVSCDGRCDKAWGINLRPAVYFDSNGAVIGERACNDAGSNTIYRGIDRENFDDYAFLADNEVSTAPSHPQTWEGGDGKPAATTIPNATYINKWCIRQCERSITTNPGQTITLPFADPSARLYNIPGGKEREEQRRLMLTAGVDLNTVTWDPAKKTFVK